MARDPVRDGDLDSDHGDDVDATERRAAMARGRDGAAMAAYPPQWDAPVELELRSTSERLAAAERLISTGCTK